MSAITQVPAGRYGFVGLGVMGIGMAKNLRRKLPEGSSLVVCDVVESQITRFLDESAGPPQIEVAASPKEVMQKADIIITMLPQGSHVLEVFGNPKDGLLSVSSSSTRKVFLECSTIEVTTSLRVQEEVDKSGVGIIADCPVSGGPNGANGGTLTFMVGSSPELFARVRPILETMGRRTSIFHCGPSGAGLATKQINNYLSSVCILGVSEAMDMGVRYGLDPKILSGVINTSSGRCYNSSDQNPVKGVTPTAAAATDFVGGFSTELCKGVIDMAVQLGRDVGTKSILAKTVQQAFQTATESDKCSGKDCRSIYRLFSEEDGRALEKLAVD